MAEYRVTLRFQFPAWDEKDGIPYHVTAKSKADAIKRAKMDAKRDGHIGFGNTGKGRATFKAEEAA
jgi:hypothetical protein